MCATLALFTAGCGGTTANHARNFVKTNLVADTAGPASPSDANLVNAWGIGLSPAGPFWISDNGTGLTTLYGGDGTPQSLVVSIPKAGGGGGGPITGQTYNGTADFVITGLGPSKFIFVSEDGVISAWFSGVSASVEADRSANGAIYKGVAMGVNGSANLLFAADFHNGQIDVFDSTWAYVKSFTDPGIPSDYAPFNIQNIGGLLYVTYAKQDSAKQDEVAGSGNGFVDVFNTDGTLNKRLVSHGRLNAPWGMAQAPAGFGTLSGALLVGNFGDGKITAFNINTGAQIGTLNDSAGVPMVIDGLWGLTFGNGSLGGSTGTLYFTAGPTSESHGIFGSIAPAP